MRAERLTQSREAAKKKSRKQNRKNHSIEEYGSG
jgi:hypothetical protein